MTFCVLFGSVTICKAETYEQYNEFYSLSEADNLNNNLNEDTLLILEEFNIDLSNPKSLASLNGFDLIDKLIKSSLRDMNSPIFVLSAVCVMVIIYAVVFSAVPKVGAAENNMMGYILPAGCMVIIAMPLLGTIKDTVSAVTSCSIFMQAFIPIYAGVIISSGKAATGGAYSALMFAVSQVLSSVADKLLVPLCSSMMVASIGAAFNEFCGKISGLLKKATVTVITLGMTVFTFVLGLQTAITSASDSVGLKTAKAAMGTFIPIVGSSLGDSLSVILGSMSLFKSSLGVYAIACLAITVVPPLVSLIVWKAVLMLLGIATQTVGVKQTSDLISMMSGVLTVLLSVLLCCALVFIISVAITLSVGG